MLPDRLPSFTEYIGRRSDKRLHHICAGMLIGVGVLTVPFLYGLKVVGKKMYDYGRIEEKVANTFDNRYPKIDRYRFQIMKTAFVKGETFSDPYKIVLDEELDAVAIEGRKTRQEIEQMFK